MRLSFLFLILLSVITASAQEKEEWKRIFTFENSVLEMNTSEITFVNNDRGRVKFRTVLKNSAPVDSQSNLKYKTRWEVIEFNCDKKKWKTFEVFFLDSEDKIIQSYKAGDKAEWKDLDNKLMSRRFFYPACQFIEEKRRNP